MRRYLVLDTDGGVDDAQALLLLIAAGRTPDMITTVFGNVDLDAATRNVATVLATAGRADVPVHMGADRPLVQARMDATAIHGADGLGGAPRPARLPEPAGRDGVARLVSVLRMAATRGERVDLLMIGPLTNLALALRLAPDCVDGIGTVTVMGGTLQGRGNITPAAEFNVFADPEAASIVFTSEVALRLVPWETCATHCLTGPEIDRLFETAPAGAVTTFSRALADHARRTVASFGGGDLVRFVDPLAAAVAIEPGIVTGSLRASVDVALGPGLTRGMTVVDPSLRLGTPAREVVERVDHDRLVALYRASISGRIAEASEP